MKEINSFALIGYKGFNENREKIISNLITKSRETSATKLKDQGVATDGLTQSSKSRLVSHIAALIYKKPSLRSTILSDTSWRSFYKKYLFEVQWKEQLEMTAHILSSIASFASLAGS